MEKILIINKLNVDVHKVKIINSRVESEIIDCKLFYYH